MIKEKLRRFAFTHPSGAWAWDQLTYVQWLAQGKPPAIHSWGKRTRLLEVGLSYHCQVFVETGTYLGGTVAAVRHAFEKVFSIEVEPSLFGMNKKRFRNASNVSLWLGGSETHMAAIVRELDLTSRKALFWLDGHYSGGVTGRTEHDCPLWFELEAIKGSGRNDHVVIIDDARCFPKDPSNLSGHEDAAYPEIGMVIQRLKAINPHYDVKIENDNIIAIAKSTH